MYFIPSKVALILCIVVFSFFACSPRKAVHRTDKFVFYNLKSRARGFTVDTVTYKQYHSGIYDVHQYDLNGDTTYKRLLLSNFESFVISRGDTSKLKHCCNKLFDLSEDVKVDVDLYVKGSGDVDGEHRYYVAKDIGLLLEMSSTWFSNSRLLSVVDNDSLTILSNIISDQCLRNEDNWRLELASDTAK